MLEIKNISKVYSTESFDQKALDGVSISFRKNEFLHGYMKEKEFI